MKIYRKIKTFIKKIRYPNLFNFRNSNSYWEERYLVGGNSGPGSYGRLADFKAEVVNEFIIRYKIDEVIEFGCGDGNQLKLFKFNKYTGVDVSEFVIKKNEKEFKNDKSRKFLKYNLIGDLRADLTMSLDVIFHLVEDDIFENYMFKLFKTSTAYVMIYSSNDEILNEKSAPHVRHRNFTSWVENNLPEFKLIEVIQNKYPFDGASDTSFCQFYFFKK